MTRALGLLAVGLAPAIAAQPPTADQTIVVKGHRPAVSRTIGSTTYDVRDNAQGQSGAAEDVLNTVPSIHVGEDGALSVRGNGRVRLYIDGKPASATASAAMLQSMAGESIASVEVITSPSAQYDGDGAAIVNIVRKPAARTGAQVTLIGNAGDHGRANLTADGSYGGKAISAKWVTSVRDDVRFTHVLNDRLVRSSDGREIARSLRDADYTPTHSHAFNLNASLTYTLTPASDVGIDLSVTHASPKNRVFEHRRDLDPSGKMLSDYERIRGGSYFGHNYDGSITYQDRGSGTRGSLRIVAQSQRDSVRSDRLFLIVPTQPPGASTGERFYNGSFIDQQRVSMDYGRPIGRGLKFSLGSELKRERLRFDNGRDAIGSDPEKTACPPPINTLYQVTKTMLASYVTVEARRGKWTLQGGARGQAVWIGFGGTSGPQTQPRQLLALNRNLSLARDIGEDQLVLKFTRSQQSFDLRDLDPLVSYVDPDTRTIGDPKLQPQNITSGEAIFSFGKGARNGALSFYYRAARDTLADYISFLSDNIQVSAKRNFGTARSYGVEATLSGQLHRRLTYSLTGNVFRSMFPAFAGEDPRRTNRVTSYTAQISVDWKTGAADALHLDANAQGPTLEPQGRKSGTYAANFVWRHNLSSRLILSLSGQSVVRQHYVRTILDTATGHDVGRRLNGGRALLVGLKYQSG